MNHRTALITQGLVAIAFVLLSTLAHGDEVPITGVVTAVDATTKTMTVEARAKGKVRQVVIDIRPTTKIVRFAREAPGGAIKEQTATLEDLALTLHPHPTIAESFVEAADLALDRPRHVARRSGNRDRGPGRRE